MKNNRRVLILLATVVVLASGLSSGCYYLRSEPVPEVSEYPLDLARLRALAKEMPGAAPVEIRMIRVAVSELPGAIMMAGRSWDAVEMTHVVFQLLRADGSYVLIDTAEDRSIYESTPGGLSFADEAWDRLLLAMDGAEQIVVTHEHPDHLGGFGSHPRAESIASKLRLTEEQLGNEDALEAANFSTALAEAVVPIVFSDATAIAPGIVLKKAAGHTPGSQMVFVQLADGSEFLFVGDVVWNLDAVTELIYRPRLITNLVIGEDREAAIHQLRALRDLYDAGQVHLVVSHDARTHSAPGIESGLRLQGD